MSPLYHTDYLITRWVYKYTLCQTVYAGTVLESTEGPTGVVTGQGKGARDRPNHPFQVTINSNTKAEPVRVMKIQVECGDVEYCDLQKMTYFIEIVDSQGVYILHFLQILLAIHTITTF